MSGTLRDVRAIPHESWDETARGGITWQTLLSGDVTASSELVCGIAHLSAGHSWALHSHPQAEVYFGLMGTVTVLVDGEPHLLAPDTALFIPPNALHGIPAVTEAVRFFYTFAADRFSDISYTFAP